MRFFELQDRARAESLRLLLLFALAVAGTVLGVHVALAAIFWTLDLVTPLALDVPRGFLAINSASR